MKIIKLIIALLIYSTSFGQITNITGTDVRANLIVTTVRSGKYVLVSEKSGTGQRRTYWLDIDSVGGSGGGGGGAVFGSITGNISDQTNLQDSFNVKAPKASPTFTGTLTAAAANFTSTINNSSWTANYMARIDASKNLISASNFYNNGSVAIFLGGSYTDPPFVIRRDFTAAYPLLRLEESGAVATSGYVDLGDGISTGFEPVLKLASDNTYGKTTWIQGQVRDAADGTGVIYSARNQAGTGALATARLFAWRNYTTEYMTMLANGALGIGTTTPAASSLLDVSSTTKGFLPPRMTGTQAEAISSPAEGLLIYSTDGSGSTITSKGWWGYEGSTWVKLN